MKYSLNAGGKRIRPVILLLTLKMLNKDYQQGLNSAFSIGNDSYLFFNS